MKYPIGILDYGVGGIDLAQRIKTRQPDTPLLYFSDSGEIPYGKLSYAQLRKRVRHVLDFMFEQGAAHIVVACHSASSVVLPSDEGVTAITDSTIQSVLDSGAKSVGIIGGGRTVRSQKYRRPFDDHSIEIKQRIAQEFSILIEAGIIDGAKVNHAVERIMKPLRSQEAILLACTHYPAIAKQIQTYVGEDKLLIDPIEHIYKEIQSKLNSQSDVLDVFYTSGDSSLMKVAAKEAFGFEVEEVKHVEL